MKILVILLIIFFISDMIIGFWGSYMEVKREIEVERKLDIIEHYIFEPFEYTEIQKKRYISPTIAVYEQEQTSWKQN